tara:strand:+ start:7466 stop:7708 length:243 start_codon:yes stop_codon:yes gene_type:complete
MTNSSYTRFRNTNKDLLDCEESMEEMEMEENAHELTREERQAAIDMIATCAEILETIGVEVGSDQHEIELKARAFFSKGK